MAATALGQTRDYAQNSAPQRYPDRDIVVVDPRFGKYKIGNAAIQRLYTGMAWAEGPSLELCRTLFDLERHSERRPATVAGRRRTRERFPLPGKQQQRQHI